MMPYCPIKVVIAIIGRKADQGIKEQIRSDKKQSIAQLTHIFIERAGNNSIADHGHHHRKHDPSDIDGQGVSVFQAYQHAK